MSLLVLGTVPVEPGALIEGEVSSDDRGRLRIGGREIPSCPGTAAMLAAALAVTRHLGAAPPAALLGGDLGRGEGTRAVHRRLARTAERLRPAVVAFHCLLPVTTLMRRSVEFLAGEGGPLLVADAGGMYAAKAAGLAPRFELMTPDVGEVGFLADPEARHPAYASRYLFGAAEFDPVRLAALAHRRGGSARVLLVKGAVDRVACEGIVVRTVTDPVVPALEPIGGTGDTLTGIAAALLAAGFATLAAAECAARANREAGRRMNARPDHRATHLVAQLPAVLGDHLDSWAALAR